VKNTRRPKGKPKQKRVIGSSKEEYMAQLSGKTKKKGSIKGFLYLLNMWSPS